MKRSDRERIPEWFDAEVQSGAPGWRERALRSRLEMVFLILDGLASRVASLEVAMRLRSHKTRVNNPATPGKKLSKTVAKRGKGG